MSKQAPANPFADPLAGGQLRDELAKRQPEPDTAPPETAIRGLSWRFDETAGAYRSTRPLDGNEQFRQLIGLSDDARVEIDGDGFAAVRPASIPDGHGGRIYSHSGTIRPPGELAERSEVDDIIDRITHREE